ncbi:YihY/virulence factor BrkB family protein [Haloplanus halophilus]|uniref:YihY/virulence factor BrkB family protein n=1 Tax=Haloplanus halophilus TaxID=2949993 RepID=UPI00203BB63F|nr:YihY/virulence factor BrkB family protein [Haloplanus sp. GDY1]
MTRLARVLPAARAVVREARARDVTLLAASVAYYAFVSVLPLLVLAAVVATTLGGPSLRTAVVALAGRYLLPVGQDLVADALANTTGQGGVTLVGLALLGWGSLKLFRGVDTAFARVYDVDPRGFLRSIRVGVTVLVAVGVGVFGGVALVGAVAVLRLPPVAVLAPLLFFAVLVAALFPVYYLLPAVDLSPREALPGTLVGALCWTLLGTAFAVYAAVASAGRFALYGALGAVLLLVTWFYLAGLALLVGATLNAVLADRTAAPNRQVQHPRDRDHVTTAMTGDDTEGDSDPSPAPDIEDLADRVEEVRADLDAFEADVQDRTVDRPELEGELKAYVRRRMRRGHARGWGPYLVLLYGTVLTLGAFYLLDDLIALVAMVVIFLSTLGLYVLFVLFGAGLSLLGKPGEALDAVRRFRR